MMNSEIRNFYFMYDKMMKDEIPFRALTPVNFQALLIELTHLYSVKQEMYSIP